MDIIVMLIAGFILFNGLTGLGLGAFGVFILGVIIFLVMSIFS